MKAQSEGSSTGGGAVAVSDLMQGVETKAGPEGGVGTYSPLPTLSRSSTASFPRFPSPPRVFLVPLGLFLGWIQKRRGHRSRKTTSFVGELLRFLGTMGPPKVKWFC